MSNTEGTNASKVLAEFNKAIDGMSNDWPSTQPSLVVQATSYTPTQFVAKLKEVGGPLQAAADAAAAYRAAIANRNDALPDATQFIQDFFAVLPQYLPKGGSDVTKFGARTKKQRAQLSAQAKVDANAKRQNTRTARHIMGKKQRAAIKAPEPTPPKTGA